MIGILNHPWYHNCIRVPRCQSSNFSLGDPQVWQPQPVENLSFYYIGLKCQSERIGKRIGALESPLAHYVREKKVERARSTPSRWARHLLLWGKTGKTHIARSPRRSWPTALNFFFCHIMWTWAFQRTYALPDPFTLIFQTYVVKINSFNSLGLSHLGIPKAEIW